VTHAGRTLSVTHALGGEPGLAPTDLAVIRVDRPPSPAPGHDETRAGTVAVVGLGYVGLPTALALAGATTPVIGVDIDPHRLDRVRSGRVDLPRTEQLRLRALLQSADLTLTSDPAAVTAADAVLVCVPTPVDAHLAPDLTALRAACRSVVEHARPGQTIILTSTTYVGSTEHLLTRPLAERGLRAGRDVHVAFGPERIDPGSRDHAGGAVPRVVGGVTRACSEAAAGWLRHTTPEVHVVSCPEVAEMSKLMENTFRAVNIAMANEFADAARVLGIDATEVVAAAATKPYGFMAFRPGPGVGGHCIPCDPHYLLWQMRRHRVSMPVVEQAMSRIAARPRQVVDRAAELLADGGRGVQGARVLLVGVAYKPGVEDVRESPAVEILERLVSRGAQVEYWDPWVPSVRLAGGRVLTSVRDPGACTPDLVLVHTVHPNVSHDWIRDARHVLDASYRLTGVPHRSVL